jgi:hypothetical protein
MTAATVALGFHRVFMAKLSLGKTGRKTRRKARAQKLDQTLYRHGHLR